MGNTVPIGAEPAELDGGALEDGAGSGRAEDAEAVEQAAAPIEVWVGQVDVTITVPEREEQWPERQPQRVVLILDLEAIPATGSIRFGHRPAPREDVRPGGVHFNAVGDMPVEGFDYTVEDVHVEGDRLEMSFATTEIHCAMEWGACPTDGSRGLIRLDLVRRGDELAGRVLLSDWIGILIPSIRLRRVE